MNKHAAKVAEIRARGMSAMAAANPAKLGLRIKRRGYGQYHITYAGKNWEVVRRATRIRHWGWPHVWQAHQLENLNEHLDAPSLRDLKKYIIFGSDYRYTSPEEGRPTGWRR